MGCVRRPVAADAAVCHSVGVLDLRARFPAVTEGNHQGWARFDGPAGTQVVDSRDRGDRRVAAQRQQRQQPRPVRRRRGLRCAGGRRPGHARPAARRRSGRASCSGRRRRPTCSRSRERSGATCGRATRSSARRLDHDSNVSPWLQVADDTGATVRLVEFDVDAGRLPVACDRRRSLTDRTRWVAVTGASNAIGTMPDITAITAAAHAAGAKVVIDGVHLTPHAPVDLGAIGCDVYSTSSYKWYGPHAGITWIEPALLDRLRAYKVRPAPDAGPGQVHARHAVVRGHRRDRRRRRVPDERRDGDDRRPRTRAVRTAARGAAHRRAGHGVRPARPRAAGADGGLQRRRVTRPPRWRGRWPAQQIAVWDGNYYALEAMSSFGVEAAVRAGIAVYVSPRRRRPPDRRRATTLIAHTASRARTPVASRVVSSLAERLGHPADARLVILSCDDLGSCHAANVGVYQAIRAGIATCASIMVPAPWARHAAAEYRPSDDIGVHLTLNAEHAAYRWGPITHAPSLLSGEGGFPRNLDDLWEHADPDEVYRELKAQIERAIAWGIDVTHLAPHLTAITLRPEFFGIYLELAHRVLAADPAAVDDHRGGRRVPVPAARRRRGRRVPRPLRPRLASRVARAGAARRSPTSSRASPSSTCNRRSTRPRCGR